MGQREAVVAVLRGKQRRVLWAGDMVKDSNKKAFLGCLER